MARILIGNIKGPIGPQGEKGIQGIQGPIGPTGPQGPLPPLVANYLATAAGTGALDAYMGKLIDARLTDLMNKYTQLNGDKIYAAGTVTAVKGELNVICRATLLAGHRYLVMGHAQASESDTSSIISTMFHRVSGTTSYWVDPGACRSSMDSGGGNITFAYVECQTDVVVTLSGYGYSARTYDYQGLIFAIQLR